MNRLTVEENVILTTTFGDEHSALVVAITEKCLTVILAGFGRVNMCWSDLLYIHKLTAPVKRQGSYGPAYKMYLWVNDKFQNLRRQ